MENLNQIARISEKSQIDALVCNTKTGITIVDTNANIVNINSSALKLLEIPTHTYYIGLNLYSIINNNEINSFIHKYILNGHDEDSVTLSLKNKQHSLRFFKKLIKEEDKNIGYLLTIKKKSLGREYKEMTELFVARVSHELKTPLTLIMGAVETLQDGALKNYDEASNFIDIIKKHAERLNMLISDLLSLGRLDEDYIGRDSDFIDINLHEIIFNSAKLFEYIAKDKNIVMEAECLVNLQLRGNKVLIEQALINLIDNACKYTNEGGKVWINAEKVSDTIHISVRDTGVGIAEKDQVRVFERFYRVDKERSRNFGGTGLGLSIVKQIAKLHNGSILLKSSSESGSIFTLIFPVLKQLS